MPIRAQAPDGTIHEFPDGTPPEAVDRAMRAYIQQSAPVGDMPSFDEQQRRAIGQFPGGGVLGNPVGPGGLRPLYVGGERLDALDPPGSTARIPWAPNSAEQVNQVPVGAFYVDPQTSQVVRREGGRGVAAINSVADGTNFNFTDELGGVLGGWQGGLFQVGRAIGLAATGRPGAGEALRSVPAGAARGYVSRRDAIRALQDQGRQDYPVTYIAGNIAGGAATLPLGGVVLRGAQALPGGARAVGAVGNAAARLLPRAGLPRAAVAGAGAGAAYGGLAGAGDGRDDRVGSAMSGAATGAVFGGAIPVVARGAGAVARRAGVGAGRVGNRLGVNQIDSDATAARFMAQQIENQGGVNAVADLLNTARADGVIGPTLADVIPGAARRVGAMARMGSDEAQELASQRASRIRQDITPQMVNTARDAAPNRNATVLQEGQRLNRLRRRVQRSIADTLPETRVPLTELDVQMLTDPQRRGITGTAAGVLRDFGRLDRGPSLAQSEDAATLSALSRQADEMNGGALTPAPRIAGGENEGLAGQLWDEVNRAPVNPDLVQPGNVIGLVRSMGGVRDVDGEIANILRAERTRPAMPGLSQSSGVAPIPGLISQNGRSLEDLVEAMRRNGMLGEAAQVRDTSAMDAGQLMDVYLSDRDRALEVLSDAIGGRAPSPVSRDAAESVGYAASVAGDMGVDIGGQRGAALSQGRALDELASYDAPIDPNAWHNAMFDGPMMEAPALSGRGYMALNNRIEQAEGGLLAQSPPDAQRAAVLTDWRNRLMAPVRQQIPGVDQMLRVGDTIHRQQNAMAQGSDVVSERIPLRDIQNAVARMSPRELRGYRQGASESLASAFNDRNVNMGQLRAMSAGGEYGQRLNAAFGLDTGNRLARAAQAGQRRAVAASRIDPNAGSQTARNLGDAAIVGDAIPLGKAEAFRIAARAVVDAVGLLTPAEQRAVVDLGTRPFGDDVAAELAAILQRAGNRTPGLLPPQAALFLGAAAGQQSGVSNSN